MISPELMLKKINSWLGKNGKLAFTSSFVMGILVHLFALVRDIPNHDGLASVYFDQNMITSGRWLLGLACAPSSYHTLPWLIGLLALLYLSIAAVFLYRILEIDNPLCIVLVCGLLVSFPSIASTMAYVFTMDGYMMGLMFAVLAVYMVNKGRFGFVIGGLFLGCSMGIYQAYLPVAMLLSIYSVVLIFSGDNEIKTKIKSALTYVYMGVIGAAFYYIVLKIMLAVQHKTLDTYQGIDQMTSQIGILSRLKNIYGDFLAFSFKGNVLFTNRFTLFATIMLFMAFVSVLVFRVIYRKWYKSVWFYVLFVAIIVILPVIMNVILIVSPEVTYHLLMRYQWAFLEIIAVAYVNDVIQELGENKLLTLSSWICVVATVIIVISYAVTDNIGYENLSRKYEKTYSYCLRLADRIEQTEGYYQGIPIYMIGVVGDDSYPLTDVTGDVTDHMVGMNGDYLLYTGQNYEQFFKHYMGISFNFLKPEEANFYYEDWYVEMPSFPAKDSIKIVNGILCIKTENSDR